jgi:hypothetical protein
VSWTQTFVLGGALAAMAGCTEPTPTPAPPAEPVYTVTFNNTETFSYGGPGCVGSPIQIYCGTWYANSYEFTGTVYGNPATRLVIDGVEFPRDPKADSLVFRRPSSPTVSLGCQAVMLSGTQNHEFSGNFFQSTDCHSAGRRGTFHVIRSDLPE